MRIHRDRFRFAPVAQQVVDLFERLFVIPAVHLVGDGQLFVRVNVVEGNRPRLALGDCVLQVAGSAKDKKRGDAAAIARPGAMQRRSITRRDFVRHVPTLHDASAPLRGKRRGR